MTDEDRFREWKQKQLGIFEREEQLEVEKLFGSPSKTFQEIGEALLRVDEEEK